MRYIEAVDTMAQYSFSEVIDDIKSAESYKEKGEVGYIFDMVFCFQWDNWLFVLFVGPC